MNEVLVVSYFSNGTQMQNWVSKFRAISYLNKPNVLIPDGTDTFTVQGANGLIISIPKTIYFFVQKVFVPKKKKPTKTGIYYRDNGKCGYCDITLSKAEATVDHIIPRSKGGQDEWINLVLSCRKCNCKKDDRTPQQAGMRLLIAPKNPYK